MLGLLLWRLSKKGDLDIQLLTSPKYHCELAAEIPWGCKVLSSKFSIENKRTKKMFEKYVSANHVVSFVKRTILSSC